ncbi:hypothetical protein [Roseisolibacter sp. H3M3-2]|uniref:hypothetical protein n=1 Tax=Roseisolibacter sp. H3M3-2 TaxID=3031323 RepID=UPI0023DC57C9|nr:hypothetical protein [Roseisolibacter sp. H3M3-2]MDF1502058.1 hypothetical protein [Roseisolibacter sp. H3M3-2]
MSTGFALAFVFAFGSGREAAERAAGFLAAVFVTALRAGFAAFGLAGRAGAAAFRAVGAFWGVGLLGLVGVGAFATRFAAGFAVLVPFAATAGLAFGAGFTGLGAAFPAGLAGAVGRTREGVRDGEDLEAGTRAPDTFGFAPARSSRGPE